MIATILLATSLTAVAELFVISAKSNAVAKDVTFAATLAAAKVEQLRGGASVVPSIVNTLQFSTDGYVDYTDANGGTLGAGTTVPEGAAFIRRWSIAPLPATTLSVIQVVVIRHRHAGKIEARTTRSPEEAHMVTLIRYAE